jgi:hypothetical protein
LAELLQGIFTTYMTLVNDLCANRLQSSDDVNAKQTSAVASAANSSTPLSLGVAAEEFNTLKVKTLLHRIDLAIFCEYMCLFGILQAIGRQILPPSLHYYLIPVASMTSSSGSGSNGAAASRRPSALVGSAPSATGVAISDIKVAGLGTLFPSQQQILNECNVVVQTILGN